jgi:hypothetical protein
MSINLNEKGRDVKQIKFCTGYGQYHSAKPGKRNPKPYVPHSLAQVIAGLETPESVPKDNARWAIFTNLWNDPLSRNHELQRKHGEFLAACADLDELTGMEFFDVVEKVRTILGTAFFAYTSSSAKPENPKCRVVVPYDSPISGHDHILIQKVFNDKLDAAGLVPDRATERAGQLFYLPNNPNGFYDHFVNNSSGPFQPLTAWVDEIQVIKDAKKEEREAFLKRQAEACQKTQERIVSNQRDVMRAFKESFPVLYSLYKYGYRKSGDKWISPNSESGKPGVSVSLDGQKWFSHHSSDAGIGDQNGEGTWGDSWDLFKYWEHGNNDAAAFQVAGDMFLTDTGETFNKANQREHMEQKNKVTADDFNFNDDDPLSEFCLNGGSEAMKKQMLDDKYILGKLALLGQWTVIYAKPNAGKTLLVMWMIIQAVKAGVIDGKDVYYVNADDTFKGLTYKLWLAENNGFMMLSPGYKGFKSEMLAPILQKLIEGDKAKGKVIILDTLKKFTDLMKKDKSSEFGEAIRQFILHGGSVIALAHTNKNRGDDGELIHSGTSDIPEDADCYYMLDIVTDDKFDGERVVKFENKKNRGDVALEASYSYDASPMVSYQDRLDSVRSLDDTEVEKAERYRDREKVFLRNKDVIEDIKEILCEKPMNQKELVKAVGDNSGVGKNRIIGILKDHNGLNVSSFQFWNFEKSADKNEKIYTLNG